MAESEAKIAVTPPAFCKSSNLREELLRCFPRTKFNALDRYLSADELKEFLKDADAVVIGRDRIDKNVLQALPGLKAVAKYGVGLDNIDQVALSQNGIRFFWTPGVNRLSVAELTLGFMIGLCHHVFSVGGALKKGQWNKDGGRQLTGKTVGVIGCGNVGMEVVRLLAPFNCCILVRDIADKKEFCERNGAEEASLETLIAQSDIITLHVPLTDLTRNLIDETVFRRMQATAFLVNTSRGEVVDERALKASLINGGIAGAALDVFSEEPPEDFELLAHPNLMVTPHIGGNSVEAVEAMGRSAIHHLQEFFQ